MEKVNKSKFLMETLLTDDYPCEMSATTLHREAVAAFPKAGITRNDATQMRYRITKELGEAYSKEDLQGYYNRLYHVDRAQRQQNLATVLQEPHKETPEAVVESEENGHVEVAPINRLPKVAEGSDPYLPAEFQLIEEVAVLVRKAGGYGPLQEILNLLKRLGV